MTLEVKLLDLIDIELDSSFLVLARNMGQKVTISLAEGEETRTITGLIAGVDDIMVTVTVDEAPEQIALTAIVKARLVIEF